MTDEQVQELLQELMRSYAMPEHAAQALQMAIKEDHRKRMALCRYVINRMVPLKGTVG